MDILDILGHTYNVVYVIGFLIKKIIWLRLVMIIAATLEIIYFYYYSDKPLWTNIQWSSAFIAVNLYQLYFLLKERITLKFNEKEKILYKLSFSPMSEIDFKKFIKKAKWNSSYEGTVLVEEGTVLEDLILIYSGIAKVESNENVIAYLGDGNFAGEMSYITKSITNAKVTSISEIEYLTWNRKDLDKLISSSKEIDESLKTIFNLDLIRKLNKKNINGNKE